MKVSLGFQTPKTCDSFANLKCLPDMFRSLNASSLQPEHVFAVTVGASSKQTLAKWHLLEPADVISSLALLNGQSDTGSLGAVAVVDGSVPESRL